MLGAAGLRWLLIADFAARASEKQSTAVDASLRYCYTDGTEDRPTLISQMKALFALSIAACVLTAISPGPGFAQTQTAAELAAEEKLVTDFTDPLTTLPQISVRDSFTPANFGTNVQTNQVIVRPIIPRLPQYSLFPFVQLIRPTFTLVTVPYPKGDTRTEFGDMQLFDLAVLPWPSRATGLLIGAGPMFVFPTATSRSAGQGAWQAGPAVGAVYKGIPWLVGGFVLQDPISFAYTSRNRPPLNTIQFQPVLALHVWEGWYLRSAEATWLCGLHRHSPTVLPLSLGIGDVIVRPDLPPLNFFVTGQWTVYRQFAPVAPQTGVNFGMIVGFPGFRSWTW